jgi:hypothetical protein
VLLASAGPLPAGAREYGGFNKSMSSRAMRTKLQWCELWVRQTRK